MSKDLANPVSGITKDKFSMKSLHVDHVEKDLVIVFSVGWDEIRTWDVQEQDPSGYYIYSEFSGNSGTTATYEVCGDAISAWFPYTTSASGAFYQPTDHYNSKFTNSYIMTNGVVTNSDASGNMPVDNPYNEIVTNMNAGDWTPESTMKDYMEWVLTNYAGI